MKHCSVLSGGLLAALLLATVPALNADSIPTLYATTVNANLGSSPHVTATIAGPGFSLSIDDFVGLYPALQCCYIPGEPLGTTLAGAVYADPSPQFPPDIGQATIDLPGGPFYAELSGEVEFFVPPNSVLPYVPPTGGVGVIPAIAVGSFSACLPITFPVPQPGCDPNRPPIANIVVDLPGEYKIGAIPYAQGFLYIDGQGFTTTPERSSALLTLGGGLALATLLALRRPVS